MSAPNLPPPVSVVVSADPSQPISPGPLIADLLRTRICVSGCVLLVEGVEADVSVSKQYRAVRLLLGDGELCVQALLRPEMHHHVDSGRFYVGCYVQLNLFEVRTIPVRQGIGESVDGQPAVDEMVLLLVREMAPVGWNTAYMQMGESSGQERAQTSPQGESLAVPSQQAEADGFQEEHVTIAPAHFPEAIVVSVAKDRETDHGDNQEPGNLHSTDVGEKAQNAETQQRRSTGSRSSHPPSNSRPWLSDDLSKPLKLTPLKSIPNLPYKQNWIVNILAVVASLSDVESATLPPFKQRTARLADPSTTKQVHLTVFLDPDEFAPQIGSVVLLLGVKNHIFDGGSLKKYGNEKPKEGSIWWIEDPRHLAWCDVDGLKTWWLDRSS